MEQRSVRSDKVLSSVEAAYVAGMVDGEGTITIGRERRDANRSGFRYFAILVIANSHHAGLQHVQQLCGNGRIDCSVAAKGRNQKPVYRLWMSQNQIRWVLPQIAPYLFIKREQAAIVGRFLSISKDGRSAPVEHWDAIEVMRAEVRGLNFRGATNETTAAGKSFVREKRPVVRTRRLRGVCQITGCGEPHKCKGYCRRHYKLYVERGGPTRYERECVSCGVLFVTRYVNARCCSKSCSDKNWSKRQRPRVTTPEGA